MQLIGCQDLCTTAPVKHIESGLEAPAPTLSPAIDTGTSRVLRILLLFAAAAGNKITGLQWSDDGETWYQCDVNLVEALGDTEGKHAISMCLDAVKRYFRVEYMTPNPFSIAVELAGMRDYPAGCENETTLETAIVCGDEMVEVEAEKTEEVKK